MRSLYRCGIALLLAVNISEGVLAQGAGPSADLPVFAAGSLRAALNEIASAYEAQQPAVRLRVTYGASGLLKDRLLAGDNASVFASANMEHPHALHAAGRAEPVQRFARNSLCALARPGLDLSPESLVQRLLDPGVKVGISTPKADPSGDYAWNLFERIEQSGTPNALALLGGKALQLTGGPSSPAPPANRNVYGMLVAQGAADVFITYCTNAIVARAEEPSLQVVDVPPHINVGADYGITLMTPASDQARTFVAFVLSPTGQAVLKRHGFSPR